MKQKQHSTEEIIRILRQAETDVTIDSVCREHNVSKATFHRWKRKYGEMDLADAKRLKELEKENAELKKMLAESLLKNRVLEEVTEKNGKPDAEEAGRCPCRWPWAVLGASGLSLPGCASINLSVSGQAPCAQTNPVTSADGGVVLATSSVWLPAHSCAFSPRGLVGQP